MESGCFCIKGIPGFDYSIKVVDKYTIIFTDLTEWMTEETYFIPEKYEINITLPDGSMKDILVNANNSTTIKATDLNQSRFIDGIYCFKIDPMSDLSGGCGNSYSKFSAIFPNLQCCLDQAMSKIEEVRYDQLRVVDSWLERSKSSAELGKQEQSLEEYSIAKKLLERLNCDCNC